MKKVFLIYPPSPKMNRTARCQQPIKELVVLPPLPPTDLMYCAAVAKQTGAECKIKDYSVEGGDLDSLKEDILKFSPDIVFVNVATTVFKNDMAVFDVIKSVNSDILTVASGAHFLFFNTEILQNYPSLDVIIRGEPELTFKDIVSGRDFEQIEGITYRKNGEIKSNQDRPFIRNFDELPFPARELVNNDLYVRPDNGEKQAIIRVEQGCPHHCFFCLASVVSGEKVRYRSPENIVAEIKECREKYDIKNFVFWSDIFSADKQWVRQLCQKITEETPDIIWGANSRVDTVDEEILKMMYNSGCRTVSFGIESGSQVILDKIGKKITPEMATKAVNMCKKNKLNVFAYFILGLPWDNEQTIKETIDFSLKLNPDYVNYYTATVFPGTKFYYYVREHNPGDFDENDFYVSPYYYPCVKTHYLSKDRIKELHKTAVRKFYLRPSYIFKRLCEIRTFTQLKNYFIAGLSVLFKK